jgi:Holliday junction resolvasome RuvABC endonuclease subunit
MKETVLALDLGTTTGWAVRPANAPAASGYVSFKTGRYEGGGMRYLRFRKWLSEMQENVGEINAVYFEEVRRHVSTDSAHVYGGLLATLTAWCEQHNIPYQGVPVATIKKHATGKGNAKKDDMIAAMRAKGIEVEDDNEADALAILFWSLATAGGQHD